MMDYEVADERGNVRDAQTDSFTHDSVLLYNV